MKIQIIALLATALVIPAFAKPIDVSFGTIDVPDDFVFAHTGTKDSFRGTLIRKSDNFTITFDIGGLAGIHMSEGKKETCTYFRSHRIGAFPATTGTETVSGKPQIVTTVVCGPKTDQSPANFWATIQKDADIADFLLIASSYQAKAHRWPQPLDEKFLIGTWVRKNAPIQGVENHTLMVLREDHSWEEAEISGPLNAPTKIEKSATDSKWEVTNVSEQSQRTLLFFKHKEGGSNSWDIMKVGAEEMDLSQWGGSIMNMTHYTRCEEKIAAQLTELLKKEDTGDLPK